MILAHSKSHINRIVRLGEEYGYKINIYDESIFDLKALTEAEGLSVAIGNLSNRFITML